MKAARRLVLEIAVLCVIGTALGMSVNAIRADHNDVTISRNYFARPAVAPVRPEAIPAAVGSPDTPDATPGPATDGTDKPPQAGDNYDPAQLGVRVASFDEARDTFEDPSTDMGLCLFVDARNRDEYNNGHIPGALLVDHYRLEKYLPDALPLIKQAERLMLYCEGGDCEDSFFLAQALIIRGVDPDKLYIFKGGWEQWEANDMPIEQAEGD
ncbi:MAG: rhodanese-like domain-containing protein [Phycisphaerales bacterium]|nr:MAG: rhodanese-like domain-containing protein [Phycisphaerales bacterium]